MQVDTGQVWQLTGALKAPLRINPESFYERQVQRYQSVRIVSKLPVLILVQKVQTGLGFQRTYYERHPAYRVALLKHGRPVANGFVEVYHFDKKEFEMVELVST